MAANESFLDFLAEQLAPLGCVVLRRMFGKTGVFCNGYMLGMVCDSTIYFRVDAQNCDAFAEAKVFPPLNYEKRGEVIDLAFWRAPDRLYDDPEEFLSWAKLAFGAAQRVKAKRDRSPTKAGRRAVRGPR